jgi:transposase
MSTSLLYHGFGIRGYKYIRTTYEGGKIKFWIEEDRSRLRCAVCGSRRVLGRGKTLREFKCVPIGSRQVSVIFPVRRLECRDCRAIRQVKIQFAHERRRHTKSFERYALGLSRHMTIKDVAVHLNVGWDVIKDIQRRNLQKLFGHLKVKKLRRIAIDEISIGRGHRYLTVVLDLGTGAVVFVGDGKGADALKPFWARLRRGRARIEAVATDMSPAYIAAVTANLPDAVLVFDHFHIIKLLNDKLTELRRELFREATEQLHKDVMKGTRWLLLKNPENLDKDRREKERLEEALRINAPLATAYYMKEELRRLWDFLDKETAAIFLQDWLNRALVSGIRILQKFAKTMAKHREGILAYFDYPISTGPLEGTNTKIRVLQRQAYGFRDMQFFKLKIMGLHETKYALVG